MTDLHSTTRHVLDLRVETPIARYRATRCERVEQGQKLNVSLGCVKAKQSVGNPPAEGTKRSE
jgi:hypothetical protein